MKARFNYYTASPDTMKAMFNSQAVIEATGLEARLINLVELRASQINGCAFCMHMHSAQARKNGVSNEHLDTWPAGGIPTGSASENRPPWAGQNT